MSSQNNFIEGPSIIQILDGLFKSSDFRAKIEKKQVSLKCCISESIDARTFFFFQFFRIFSIFFYFSTFFSLKSIEKQQSTHMWFLAPFSKNFPRFRSEILVTKPDVYKWPKMKRLGKKKCSHEFIRVFASFSDILTGLPGQVELTNAVGRRT